MSYSAVSLSVQFSAITKLWQTSIGTWTLAVIYLCNLILRDASKPPTPNCVRKALSLSCIIALGTCIISCLVRPKPKLYISRLTNFSLLTHSLLTRFPSFAMNVIYNETCSISPSISNGIELKILSVRLVT